MMGGGILVLVLAAAAATAAAAAKYNIMEFGAKEGEDSTTALLRAWEAACSSREECVIVIPAGKFSAKKVDFRGPCSSRRIVFEIYGTLVAPSDYRIFHEDQNELYWIQLRDVSNVSIHGGVLDGRGSSLWACKLNDMSCSIGVTSLKVMNSRNVGIEGLTSRNSELFHIAIDGCKGIVLRKLKVIAPSNSPNTDGIHVEASDDVTVADSSISTGDDCISVGPGTTNLRIRRVSCGPGHGISIGSLGRQYGEKGVENVTLSWANFTGTQNGLRIKSWGRPSRGYVRGLVFSNVFMSDVMNPIIIDQKYCPGKNACPGETSGVKISRVKYTNVRGTSATPVAVTLDCSSSNPCSRISMKDIDLTFRGKPARSFCANAGGAASGFVRPPSCLR